MTKTDTLTGEQREARKRRNFWLMMAAFMVGGGITGAFSGVFTGDNSDVVSPQLVIGFVVIFLAAFIGLSWYFFKNVDELELADNLWGGLFGLYFYLSAVPISWLLEQSGIIAPLGQWPIYFATVAVTFSVYLVRKFLNR